MDSWPETRISLIRRLANPGDAAGWEQFEAAYRPTIYRYVRSRGLQPSDAMDAVQEILLAVHKQAMTWQSSGRAGSFRAWLAETARRTTLHQLRVRARVTTESSGFREAAENQAERDAESGEEVEERRWRFCRAAAAVESQVGAKQWSAFWRTAVDGVSPESVAVELGMRVGAVYTAKSRVQSRVRATIETMRRSSGEE